MPLEPLGNLELLRHLVNPVDLHDLEHLGIPEDRQHHPNLLLLEHPEPLGILVRLGLPETLELLWLLELLGILFHLEPLADLRLPEHLPLLDSLVPLQHLGTL